MKTNKDVQTSSRVCLLLFAALLPFSCTSSPPHEGGDPQHQVQGKKSLNRAKSIRYTEEDYARWREENPGKKFSDYYVEAVAKWLDAGRPHPTLGKKLEGDLPWEESGLHEMALFLEEGLRPEHVCVDYGCGSLRIGQHVMRYVDPGNYWGLDVTDRFYRDGVEMIGPEEIAERRPNLRVITPETVAEARAAEPDLVFAVAVLIHVPPEELDDLLRNLTTLVLPQTRAYVTYLSAEETMRLSGRTWVYSEDFLTEKIEALGARVEFRPGPTVHYVDLDEEIRDGWLVITRPGG